MIVEICAHNFASAEAAQYGGAHRIELCTELGVGGLTPSHGLIEKVMTKLKIPVHVLIRPRSGNFIYSEEEIDVMIKDILYCRKSGCSGVVSGVLNSNYDIDRSNMQKLITAAEGMEFTFHRAFDCCRNPMDEINSLIELNVSRLLSSGLQSNAIEGIELLKSLKNLSQGQLEIMPGSGINKDNVSLFLEAGFESIHLSATTKQQGPDSGVKKAVETQFQNSLGTISDSNPIIIRDIVNAVSG